ncbi:MAG: alpha/beta hydrolase [Zoogloeaceae bacterium]|nr:alpha/beta hydrolase [Zoogloeaceae bacterium]
MKASFAALWGVLAIIVSPCGHAADESLESIESRGLAQKFILTRPSGNPIANVILLPGGHGRLGLDSFSGAVSMAWGKDNNLVRTRDAYADQGFLVATMDAPSDRGKMNAIWRMGEQHARDIASVAAELRRRANAPVWVIGTSMGSFSAANAGIRLKDTIDGIVLTSSITRSKPSWSIRDEYPDGVINMALDQVTAPVMVISHADDRCALTPPTDLDRLAAGFSSAVRVEKVLFTGADRARSDPCQALSPHGFIGIENDVVLRISAFIKAD